jgi:hypothetical protein
MKNPESPIQATQPGPQHLNPHQSNPTQNGQIQNGQIQTNQKGQVNK